MTFHRFLPLLLFCVAVARTAPAASADTVLDAERPAVGTIELPAPVGPDFSVTALIRMPERVPGKADPYEVIAAMLCGEDADRLMLRMFNGRVVIGQFLAGEYGSVGHNRPLQGGARHHLVATFEGDLSTLYLDGVPVASSREPRPMNAWTAVEAGRWRGDNPFGGTLLRLTIDDAPLTSAEVAERFAAAGVPVAEPPEPEASFGRWPALRVEDDAVHPISVGFGPAVETLPDPGGGPPDLLLGGINGRGFGVRLARYRPVGSDPSGSGLPLYDAGETVLLRGAEFARVDRPGGGFDLLSGGKGTRYGIAHLVQHRATGSAEDLAFADPEPVLVGGQPFGAATGGRSSQWATGDLDGDGVDDLLAVTAEGPRNDYWPNAQSVWAGVERADAGRGRGYGIDGGWLGSRRNTRLFWARGERDAEGRLAFSALLPVHDRHRGFQVQWKSFATSAFPGFVRIGGEPVILLLGDLDRVLALRYDLEDGDLVCRRAEPLLSGDARLRFVSHTGDFAAADLGGDGTEEVLISGNPGRVTVLRGDRIGGFEEVGSLNQRGGFVELDNPASPSLQDRDGDGFADLVAADAAGWITRWPGTDDPMVFGAPRWMTAGGKVILHQGGPTGSVQGPNEARWGYTQVTAGTWGGEPVVFANDATGFVTLYRGHGPDVLSPEVLTRGGEPLPVAWRVKPAIVPAPAPAPGSAPGEDVGEALLILDFDGDVALALPETPGGSRIAEVRKLGYEDGTPIRTDGPAGDWGRTKLAAADWDGDGAWDLLAGVVPRNHERFRGLGDTPEELDGSQVFWFRNTGTDAEPRFAAPRLIRPRDGGTFYFGYHSAAPCLADLSGNGREDDLLIGAEDGKVYAFRRDQLAW